MRLLNVLYVFRVSTQQAEEDPVVEVSKGEGEEIKKVWLVFKRVSLGVGGV